MYRAGIREMRNNAGRYASFNYTRACNILREVSRTFLEGFGPDDFVDALSQPFFTDFLLVTAGLDEIGGASTLVLSAILKESITFNDGLAVLGGKFLAKFNVPKELDVAAEYLGLSPKKVEHLKYCSRMAAKIDSVAIQDGFELYFHMMIISASGMWTIIQQSQNPLTQTVRRYHWFSGYLRSFVEEPHTGIITQEKRLMVLDMTARESSECRKTSVELLKLDISKLHRLRDYVHLDRQTRLTDGEDDRGRRIEFLMPVGILNWRLLGQLSENPPKDYEGVLAVRGVGREIVKLLALGSMVYFDVSPSFKDPAFLFDEVPENYDDASVLYRFQQVVDSVRNSRMPAEMKRHCLRRLSTCFGESEYEGLAG